MINLAKHDIIKYISLIVLVVQNCLNILFSKHVLKKGRPEFLKTIVVFFGEILKFSISFLLVCIEEKSLVKGTIKIYNEFIVNWRDTLKVLVPAAVYTAQNLLFFVAVDHLAATTYMVSDQFKILPTVFFTIIILKRKLSIQQWMALLVLFSGVVIVQYDQKMSNDREKAELAFNNSSNYENLMGINGTTQSSIEKEKDNSIIGIVAVIVACCLSGFAGVYFEKVLKDSNVSVWIRNIQLSLPSIFFAFLLASVFDFGQIYGNGISPPIIWNNMLKGFDWAVWVTILINAFGGLVVAVVIKYADNILKAFATSCSIVLNCIAAFFLFTFRPTILFVVGVTAVIAAVFAYSMYPYKVSDDSESVEESKVIDSYDSSSSKIVEP